MCIIAIKCKGVDFAPISIIKNCIENNPDGFSMAWNEGGVLKSFRTMDPAEALARYYTVSRLDPAETALVFHARIATHGSKKVENCHCWTYADTIAFAHNGILRNIANRDDMTDSETFFRDYFIPAIEGVGWNYALKIAKAVIEGTCNKFSFIDRNGNVYLSGDFVKEQVSGAKGKLYFSNTSYRPRCQYGFGFGQSRMTTSSLSARKPKKDSQQALYIRRDADGKAEESRLFPATNAEA